LIIATVDCLIVGAGPAGLTAAIFTARFNLSVVVIDAGSSRAALIPCTRNHAGFPDGISGEDLLRRMRLQAATYGATLISGTVGALEQADDAGFNALGDFPTQRARAVILATGVTNRRPQMPNETHDAALAGGQLRYCPVCDGYEVTDQRVGVVGTGAHGLREASFLRSFTANVTLIAPDGPHTLDVADRQRLDREGVVCIDGPAADFALTGGKIQLRHAGGVDTFDAIYPALGSDIHSDLARQLGADLTGEGCVRVDAHQRTSIPHLYAAGHVVIGLDQISHAMGEAGVAATTLRNDLSEMRPNLRG
jgi:thioredoxin reductase (NADPH)